MAKPDSAEEMKETANFISDESALHLHAPGSETLPPPLPFPPLFYATCFPMACGFPVKSPRLPCSYWLPLSPYHSFWIWLMEFFEVFWFTIPIATYYNIFCGVASGCWDQTESVLNFSSSIPICKLGRRRFENTENVDNFLWNILS